MSDLPNDPDFRIPTGPGIALAHGCAWPPRPAAAAAPGQGSEASDSRKKTRSCRTDATVPADSTDSTAYPTPGELS